MLCGWALVAIYAALAPVSYAIAARSPFGVVQEHEVRALERVVDALPLGDARAPLRRAAAGEGAFRSAAARGAAYGGAMAAATLVFCAALLALARDREAVDDVALRTLVRFAWAFGAVNVLAYPMFTQDFWLSVAWGRMWADGVNPYHHAMPASALAGLPLEEAGTQMTYGPLWALLVGTLERVVPHRAPLEFGAHKAVLLLAWGTGLHALARLHAHRSPALRAGAIALLGWAPMSVHFTVAEGHNDALMTCGLLLWLEATVRARAAWAPPAIVASALFKYVTAPLVALEIAALAAPRERRRRATAILASGVGALAVFALFWDDAPIFGSTVAMQGWHLLTPADAVRTAVDQVRARPIVDALVLAAIAWGAWPGLRAGLRAWESARSADAPLAGPQLAVAAEAALAGLLAAACVAVGHTWPWFLLWPLAAAAAVPRSRLAAWSLPIFLVAPFFHLLWAMGESWDSAGRAGVVLWTAVALVAWPAHRWLRPALAPAE
ncbi:MAG: hypothetical protein R3E88_13085 [Myxococcota bacterium]